MLRAPQYFDVKRKIERLTRKSPTPEERAQWLYIFKSILKGMRINAITLSNNFIYRARWNMPSNLFGNISDLIYPPAGVAGKGRFNQAGESIFYGAACELGTIIELRPKIGELFTISRFSRRALKDPMFFPLAVRDKEGKFDRYNPNPTGVQKLFGDFLHEALTVRGNNPGAYDLSIMMGRHFFATPLALPEGPTSLGLAYPSVESRFISNQTTYNVAMLPELFDSTYIFDECYVYGLTHEIDHYQLNQANYATADADGKLHWRFTLEQMTSRLSEGVLLDGEICPGMAAAAKQAASQEV